KSSQARRTPATFAGDYFVAAFRKRPGQDRLHHTLGLDRIGQLGERRLVETETWLKPPGAQRIDGHHRERLARRRAWLVSAEERLKAAPQSFGFCHATSQEAAPSCRQQALSPENMSASSPRPLACHGTIQHFARQGEIRLGTLGVTLKLQRRHAVARRL